MPNIIKDVLLSVLPPGAAWTPKESGYFDSLLSGMAINSEDLRLFLEKLADIRDPQKTDILSDLEKEFGIIPWSGLTEQERRDNLEYHKKNLRSDGTGISLQERLIAAGFDCIVVENTPPVDTDQFVGAQYQAHMGGINAVFGDQDFFFQKTDTRYIVNADSYLKPYDEYEAPTGDDAYLLPLIFFIAESVEYEPEYSWYFEDETSYLGNENANFSEDTTVSTNPVNKLIPFSIPAERKTELERLILTSKPMHSWAVVSINII